MHVETQLDTALLIRIRQTPPDLPADAIVVLSRDRWTVRASDDFEHVDALRDGVATTAATVELRDEPESPWLVLALAATTSLAGVRAVPPSAGDSTIYLARIELSLDGTTWEAPRTWFEPDDRQALIEHPRTVRYFEARFVPAPARYVRLLNGRANFRGRRWEVGELDLLAPAAP